MEETTTTHHEKTTAASEFEQSKASTAALEKKLNKMSEEEKRDREIRIVMQLPEVRLELLKRANPHNFNLYDCAFGEGGELQVYATYIHKKLLQLRESQTMQLERINAHLTRQLTDHNALGRQATFIKSRARYPAARQPMLQKPTQASDQFSIEYTSDVRRPSAKKRRRPSSKAKPQPTAMPPKHVYASVESLEDCGQQGSVH